MEHKNKRKVSAKVIAAMLATTMVVSSSVSVLTAYAANNGIGTVSGNYATLAEAQTAAEDLNTRLTGEGTVLLKNKSNALPVAKTGDGKATVTVFKGSSSLAGASGSATLERALADDGFTVNSTVVTSSTSNEALEALEVGENSVAVVIISRSGGEGSDLAVATSEAANDAEENDGWTHKRLAKNASGTEVKHNNMLTNNEVKLIEAAKAKCDKVVVLLNTSHALEMYNLQHDDGIDAILDMGRPGKTGILAIPKLLSGEWNPSGKMVAEWYKDFTADPTWYNSVANAQNDAGSINYMLENGMPASSIGLYGVDYSEDIYIGYKYYETVYAEIAAGRLQYAGGTLSKGAGTLDQATAWHADNVVYPFGYGLSYTSFTIGAPTIKNKADFTSAKVSSSATAAAQVKQLELEVTVTNTGAKAGKEVVEIYSQAPYTVGGIEKAAVSLVGYAKTGTIAPGASEKVTIKVNVQDMASYDYKDANDNGFKGYELEKGVYTLYASNTSHCTAATAKETLTLDADAKLVKDDFSDNNIENLFSEENGRYNSLRTNGADWNGDGTVDAKDKMFTEEQVLLSRSDLVGTFPEAPVVKYDGAGVASGARVVTKEFADLMDTYAKFDLNLWAPTYGYFTPSAGYKVGDKFGISNTKTVYQIGEDADAAALAIKELTYTSAHAVDEYIYAGNNIYKVTKAIEKGNLYYNGFNTSAVRNYEAGDVVIYYSSGMAGVTVNTKLITAEITAGSAFNNTNSSNATVSSRLVTTGEDANVEAVTQEAYFTLIDAETTAEENGGSYVYSDKLFDGTIGANANGQSGLVEVNEGMMAGWSQIADTAAQTAAKEAAGSEWIYFNDLNGIKFNDTAKIAGGKFDGMTGVEVWTKFMNQWTWNDYYTACWNGGNNGNAVANLGIPVGGIADSPTNFNSTYSWCCNCSIAATWNVELGYEEGALVAEMGLLKNATSSTNRDQWLNPAVNFQRAPFSGRNSEYYSQDGYQAGHFAAAVAQGIQSRGIGSHLKHMFLNDQETARNAGDLMAWVSEQAIREIYIKPFQMAIQEGGAEGAMSAFARIGSVPTPVNYNMCDLLVRGEWGATNFMFHPDMYSPQSNVSSEDLMLRAGHNHAPGGNNTTNQGTPANNTYSGRWDANYDNPVTGTKGGVYIGREVEATGQETYYSNNQWYIVRFRAMQMYSEYANQAHSQNGVVATNGSKVMYTTLDNTYDVKALFGENNHASTAVYTLKGTLPAGLTFNAETGIISGIPTTVTEEDVVVTVDAVFDQWITASAQLTITVKPPQPLVNIQLADGKLIVTYEDGTVEEFVLGSFKGEPGIPGNDGNDGEDGLGIASATINDKGELVLTYTDGTTKNLGNVVGADGQNGAPGAPGAPGTPGEPGEPGTGNNSGTGLGTAAIVLSAVSLCGVAALVVINKRKHN